MVPALAVWAELRRICPAATAQFWCSNSPAERQILANAGVCRRTIVAGKWRRYCSFQNLFTPFLVFVGFFQSLFLMGIRRPDVIFSKGGFVAVPVCAAAFVLRVPIIIHESDAVPGLATRLCRPFAHRFLSAFALADAETVGLPMSGHSPAPRAATPKKQAIKRPKVLAFFGSRGSVELNSAILGAAADLAKISDVLWILGPENLVPTQLPKGVVAKQFLPPAELRAQMQQADLVLCRSGSGALEVAQAGSPMLLFPLAHAAGNHQVHNAQHLANSDAARVFCGTPTPARLAAVVADLLGNPDLLASMRRATAAVAKSNANAAQRCARAMVEEAGRLAEHSRK